MDLERAARMAPDHIRLVLDAGHACAELGEWERSEEHWRQALRLDGTCEEALVQLADSRRALHDAEGARRMLRECLLVHPDSLDAQERLAELEAN
jgi:Flp pilus assembly protein TadD